MSFWCCFAGLGLVGAGSEIGFCLDERDSMMIYKNWGCYNFYTGEDELIV